MSKTYYHCAACNTKLSEPSSDGLCTNCRAAIEHPPRPQDTNRADDQPTIVHDRPSKDVSQNTRRSVGDYELIEEIARGGMGVVYKARQRSLDRTVALKMILSGNLASQEDRERFEREAQAAAKLDHPGIVPIYEVGHEKTDSGQQHYFSMALVEGESLSERISRHSMSSKQAAAMMLQISAAVQYAHDHGIIHRDLKPANVLIDSDERSRITDFGLAKNVNADSQLTATGQVMGTPSYMPPEQVTGKGQQIGAASDVYALGAILYCMVTGKPPFQSESLLETLTQVLEREPEAPSELVADIDPDLETICLKCLEKKPEQRFASVRELREELVRYVSGEPILSRKIGVWERIARWRRMVQRNPDVRIQSRTKLFGIPLVSIAFGRDDDKGEQKGHAQGIFAFGDRATGVLSFGTYSYGIIAWGMHARGVVAFGSTSVGIASTGFFSAGVFSFGAISAGYFAMGFIAIGYTAIGFATVGKFSLGAYRWTIGS